MAADTVELKVKWHPSGRYTLEETYGLPTITGQHAPSHTLIGNDDAAEFYRAVAERIATLAGQGKEVSYSDTSADKEGTPEVD